MPDNHQRKFGDGLREAREQRGISLREIAASTKISKVALEALERDDVSSLPGGIFTRSFVRSYADAVGLDAEATLREFLNRFPIDGETDGTPTAVDPNVHDEFKSQQRMARTVLGLLVVSVPLVAFLMFIGMGGEGLPDAESDARIEAVSAAGPATSPAPMTPPVAARREPPPVVEAAAVGPLTIDIHPQADCWVSATVDGERRFSRVMRAGEREVLEAEREIVVNVGDAGAFAFAINQRPGRSLGTPGEVVTARINRDNYRSFVTE